MLWRSSGHLGGSEIEALDSSGTGRLEGMTGQFAPAHRKEITRVVACPVVEIARPTIERDENMLTRHFTDSGWADELGVMTIYGLQLVAFLKEIAFWVRRWLKG